MPSSISGLDRQLRIAGQDGEWSKAFFILDAEGMQRQVAWKRSVMPSRRDIRMLLGEFFSSKSVDSTVFYSTGRLQCDLDTLPQLLEDMCHMLQDHLGLIKRAANEFTGYRYEYIHEGQFGLANSTSLIDKAIAANSTRVGRQWNLQLEGAGMATTGLKPSQVVGRLKELAESGRIRLSPPVCMTKAHIVRYPSAERGPGTLRAITELLYEENRRRLEAWTRARRQVVELFTRDRCTTVGFAEHFGTEMPGGRTRCGRCDWCRTGRPLVLSPGRQEEGIDRDKVTAVLAAVPDRDHPRFLARVGTGCRSPRVAKYNLDKSPVFGSMRDVNFDVSLFDLHVLFLQISVPKRS